LDPVLDSQVLIVVLKNVKCLPSSWYSIFYQVLVSLWIRVLCFAVAFCSLERVKVQIVG